MDKYNLNQHNTSHNGLFMSELLFVHGFSPIPNVLQEDFHIFFFCWNSGKYNIKQKIAAIIAEDWGALWAPQSSAMTSLGSRCQNLHYNTPKRAQKIHNSYAGARMRVVEHVQILVAQLLQNSCFYKTKCSQNISCH